MKAALRRSAPASFLTLAGVGHLAERGVGLVLEPALHVPEAVLVGHELDAALGAPVVERGISSA
jgi:hypothetical protein